MKIDLNKKTPILIKDSNKAELDFLKKKGVIFIDTISDQISELCEINNPSLRNDNSKLLELQKKMSLDFKDRTIYCFYPWRKVCVRLLPKQEWFALKTARNKNLVTSEEQDLFRNATIGVAGLSVGSNIARLCVLQGGPQRIALADGDSISPTNLNRMLTGVHSIGRNKAEVLSEDLYEMDPFLKLKLFSTGLSQKNISSFFQVGGKSVNIIVEEVDSMPIKIELRRQAAQRRVPVISLTDNGDGVIVDIERYDLEYTIDHFMSRLKGISVKPDDPIQKKVRAISAFIGLDDIDTRMLESCSEVGQTLYSWPQLGGAAVMAGVIGAYCVRQIVCGKSFPSGRRVVSLSDIFNGKNNLENSRRKNIISLLKS